MKVFVVFAICCVALSSAQWDWWNNLVNTFQQNSFTIDTVHEFRFDEHDRKGMKLLIAISSSKKECHVIEIDDVLEPYLRDDDVRIKVTEDIYRLIKSKEAKESPLTHSELNQAYHDLKLSTDCLLKDVFSMKYTPTFPMPTKAPVFIATTTDLD